MSGAEIAAEVALALGEVGTDTGTGPLIATLLRAPGDAPTTPWATDPGTPPTEYPLNVIRDTWKRSELESSLIRATDLKLMVESSGTVPTVADTLTLQSETYNIQSVLPESIGGVDLYYIVQARK